MAWEPQPCPPRLLFYRRFTRSRAVRHVIAHGSKSIENPSRIRSRRRSRSRAGVSARAARRASTSSRRPERSSSVATTSRRPSRQTAPPPTCSRPQRSPPQGTRLGFRPGPSPRPMCWLTCRARRIDEHHAERGEAGHAGEGRGQVQARQVARPPLQEPGPVRLARPARTEPRPPGDQAAQAALAPLGMCIAARGVRLRAAIPTRRTPTRASL